MYNIEVCYKFIFGAMFEEAGLTDIAEKVHEYTGAGVFFVSCTGEILAYSCKAGNISCSLKNGCLTLEDYDRFFDEDALYENQRLIFHVYKAETIIGYVVLTDINAEYLMFFQELGKLLMQASRNFFEEKENNNFFHFPLREQVICRTVFSEGECCKNLTDILAGNYIIAVFSKNHVVQESDYLNLRSIWHYLYAYEESDYITIILYRINQEKAQEIYSKTENMKLKCCISEMFEDLNICRSKQNFLKQIMSIQHHQTNMGIRREKDWYMEGLFAYTSPYIKEAGLSDYSILRLIDEDKKNNTEFYHTLKMYLLCENNITMAAEKLYIHRNTMVYRLKQIKSFIGSDFNDGDISRNLLAFMMMHDAAEGQKNKV